MVEGARRGISQGFYGAAFPVTNNEFIRQQQQADQAAAWMSETLPATWVNMRKILIDGGFNSSEAFELVRSWIIHCLASKPAEQRNQ